MVKIIPAILTNNLAEFRELVSKCIGVVDRVQVDFVDAEFASSVTIVPLDARLVEFANIKFDAHLMVSSNNVEKYIQNCAAAGFDRIITQVESVNDQKRYVDLVKGLGAKVGLALDLDTGVGKLNKKVLNNLDVVLIMSVPAGFGGQEFDEGVLVKIESLRKYKVCVDGGILPENIGEVARAGASEASVGRCIFDGDLKTNIKKYEK